MKKLFALALFIGLLHSAAVAQSRTYDLATKILDEKNVAMDYSAMDVAVYKYAQGYVVEFYAVYGQEIKMHKFMIESLKRYNMANYTWESEHKLIMQFSSTDSADIMIFRLEGAKNGTSTIEIIETK